MIRRSNLHLLYSLTVIRRDGEFRGINLNELFIKPYRTHMMNAWDATFQVDLFANLTSEAMIIITQLAKEIEDSALTEPMKLSVKKQGERAIEEARETLGKLISVAGTMVMDGRKQASRLLMPHIQTKLIAAYSQAKVITGQGSLKKRQVRISTFPCFADNGNDVDCCFHLGCVVVLCRRPRTQPVSWSGDGSIGQIARGLGDHRRASEVGVCRSR